MQTFHIERRKRQSFAGFFPDPITKERHRWGQTLVGTEGCWTKYRFVTGDLVGLLRRVRDVAMEYSQMRKRFEHIDVTRLFESAPGVQATPLEYHDYTGMISSIGREAVDMQYRSGGRRTLNRNERVGFRGIITRTDEPWSDLQFALDQLIRYRMAFLATGANLPDISTRDPWRLRDAAERSLSRLFDLAWSELALEPTLEKTQQVIDVEARLQQYVLDSLSFVQHAQNWEFMKGLPFPDRAGAIRLWEQDILQINGDERATSDSLNWAGTEPWWLQMPSVHETEVTACRRAYLVGSRFQVQLTMNPEVYSLEHGLLDVANQVYTYGTPKQGTIGEAKFNPPSGKTSFKSPYWNGGMTEPKGWSCITGEAQMPEPKIKVRSRAVRLDPQVAERIQAALAGDRPVLIEEGINDAVAPILVVPRLYMQASLVPLFGRGRRLTPLEETSKVSGWAVASTGAGNFAPNSIQGMFGATPPGFLETPLSGNAMRDAALQEILPFS